ncbi:Prefoldin_subunit 6 [Hexamita inflata]|uniref:Prefoldin subunit 6 n=1 Tax=Hexamita inflata TaxID=28002 RepID=A0AA86PNB2_9EUKA|nr:Prefoldin subunit 6 [Hexamita inflata]
MDNVQKKFEQLQQEYIQLQQSRAKLIDIRYENELVKKDLTTMNGDQKLFKINGPTLLPKSLEEVQQAVEDKLIFVNKQIEALDKQMSEKEKQIIDVNKQRLSLQQQPKK